MSLLVRDDNSASEAVGISEADPSGVPEHAGASGCSLCSCPYYTDNGSYNNYCTCGHAYGDHW